MSIPATSFGTCLAAVFVGAGRPLELRRIEVPVPEAGEALVRIECCTLCGSDLHTIRGARTEPTPSILGHEILGVVAEVGDPAPSDLVGNPLQPGDRITWSTSASCGVCDRCQSGLPQKCRTLFKYGHAIAEGRQALSGGLSEFLLLRRGSAVVRLSPDLPAEVICPVNCATATIAAAFRMAGPSAGRRVLILGAGMLGLTAAAYARSLGAQAIAICDVDERRLARGLQFGANTAVVWQRDATALRKKLHSQGSPDAFDQIIEVSGSPEAIESAFHLADVGARIVLVGSVLKSRPVEFDPEQVVRRWLTVQGVHNYSPDDLRAAVTFLEESGGAWPFAALVEASDPLADVNAALEMAIQNRPVRIAIRP